MDAELVQSFLRATRKEVTQRVTVLYFGRLSLTSKGDLFTLLIAWQRVARSCPDAQLVIAGDDTQQRLARQILDAAAALACSDSVTVIPDPNNAQKLRLYAEADIFISPSDSLQETFGITILEAMASGLPIIASDWSGYREIVLDSVTGFLIPTIFPSLSESDGSSDPFISDIPAASTVLDLEMVVEKLCLLIKREDLRFAMGEAGKKRAMANYAWPNIIRQHDELHQELRERAHFARERSRSSQSASRGFYDVAPSFFGHFATSTMGSKSKVRRVSESSANMKIRASLAVKNYYGVGGLKLVLGAIPGNGWQDIDSVVGRLQSEDTSTTMKQSEIFRHLGRLAKYALIEIH